MSAEDWEVFKSIKEERQKKRGTRRDEWQKLWETGQLVGWTRHSETHYSYTLLGKRLDYWPGPMKWQYEGKIHHGAVLDYVSRRERKKQNA